MAENVHLTLYVQKNVKRMKCFVMMEKTQTIARTPIDVYLVAKIMTESFVLCNVHPYALKIKLNVKDKSKQMAAKMLIHASIRSLAVTELSATQSVRLPALQLKQNNPAAWINMDVPKRIHALVENYLSFLCAISYVNLI